MTWQANIYDEIPDRLEIIGEKIVDAAYKVYKKLGPGLLEHIYEVCFVHELQKKNLKVERQKLLPIKYDNLTFDEGLKLDMLVENEVICELKAVDTMNSVWEVQILSHLKLTDNRLGYLINLNVRNIGKGIKRFVL